MEEASVEAAFEVENVSVSFRIINLTTDICSELPKLLCL